MPRHFKTFNGYKKYQAFIHIHKIPHKQHRYVYVGGHKYKVKHHESCPYCRKHNK